jgi:cytidine deaminase
MTREQLVSLAQNVRQKAYAPYSQFKVGAVLLTADGEVFCGCNVENVSFGLTICAERAALCAAVAAGRTNFAEIVIVADSTEPVSPCGACRQVLAEFAPSLQVHCENLSGKCYDATLAELLPRPKEGILG